MLHVQESPEVRAKMHVVTLFFYVTILFNNFPAPSCSCVMQQAAATFCGCFPQQIKSQKGAVNVTCPDHFPILKQCN